MSLNGLDTPEVTEAYQTAIAEAGGWFLLKYTSRDSVDLLGKGKHGVSEARNALAAYTEASPLYGLLMYRRRRILIKYIPEGTSRLLQARTSVHLQDVLERYSPYETLLELTSGDGLNDTALAASFQLHTASPSPSMGRLDELREEDEDEGTTEETGASAANLQASQRYRSDRGIGKRAPRSMTSLHAHTTASRRTTPPASPAKSPALTLPVPAESTSLPLTPLESPVPPLQASAPGDQAADDLVIPEHKPPPTESSLSDAATALQHVRDTQDKLPEEQLHGFASQPPDQRPPEPSPERNSFAARGGAMRSQSMDEEPFDFSQYDALFKPKVKLAPRPINAPEKALRPTAPRVSAVPATIKTMPKKQEALRPKSSGGQAAMSRSATAPSALESAAPAMPPIPDIPTFASRPMSRGSVRSAPLHKSGPMSADKIRLMKAVELRKKQLRKSQGSMFSSITEDAPEVPSVPMASESQQGPSDEGTQSKQEEAQSKILAESEPEQHSTDDESQNQSTKADSGIELRYGTPDTQRTEETIDEAPENAVLDDISEEKAAKVVSHASLQAAQIDATVDESDTNHDDAASTTPSQTPTERPLMSEQDSETTAKGSQHLKVDEGGASAPTISLPGEQDNASIVNAAGSLSPHKRSDSDLVKRRRGYVQPLALDTLHNEVDEEELDSDDDALYEELHSATVQEARPITVARSPIALAFQGRSASIEASNAPRPMPIARAFTNPEKPADDERPPSVKSRPSSIKSRSVSPMPPAERQELLSAGRARNVSSGISRRIQALAELSARESSENSLGGSATQNRRVPPATRPMSRKRQSRSAVNTPTSAMSNEEQWLTGSVQHDPVTKRDSVSVTTRIARPGSSAPGSAHGPTPPFSAAPSATPSPPAVESEPPLSSNNSLYSNDTRSVKSSRSRTSRFWKERQKSAPALDDFPPPPPNVRVNSAMSLNSNDENVAPEKASKATRFFKRMSNLTGSKKKNSPVEPRSPTKSDSMLSAPEAARPVSLAVSKPDTPPAVVVGDLNVQFPDSLLWKRRIVTIDDYGVLQFAIAQAMDIHRGVAMKRYALAEFKAPFMPVLDQQELPYSVILEFEDGTALQVACEDGMTQRQVLSLLTTYWRAYTEDTVEQQ
ncbi:hypothetical protein CB0940_03247 [Cercospora beticola]|uniref:ADF-H domain-containing protein n=1 Tax=Cercospora beticola TaxID=122368 RepID=A0A2G5I4X8_CERBT|nr:hypothetical protein CB0940_03247 [Cercospora beticola]PIA99552.1 hypothetical protein CB0940_03247 [Cercospora beticola]WPB00420.1 hypothetical protein RHO25_005039 [Cercospora beticola]CAK1361367.1 unnamed protein product [Cercospora beticola]